MARVWQDVLRVPVRAAEDDFFDNGGDSLNAITFVLELERALELEISLTLINEAPRFDQLCQALRERRAPGSTPLVTLKAGDGLPPVFFIHGVGGNVVEILPAARRVTYPGAVIGIRARGVVRGEDAAHEHRGDGRGLSEGDQEAPAERSVLPVRLFLRRACGVRDCPAPVRVGR